MRIHHQASEMMGTKVWATGTDAGLLHKHVGAVCVCGGSPCLGGPKPGSHANDTVPSPPTKDCAPRDKTTHKLALCLSSHSGGARPWASAAGGGGIRVRTQGGPIPRRRLPLPIATGVAHVPGPTAPAPTVGALPSIVLSTVRAAAIAGGAHGPAARLPVLHWGRCSRPHANCRAAVVNRHNGCRQGPHTQA
jgi:hypothetical protein